MYDDLKGEIFSFGSRIERLEKQVEQQEVYSRRDNLLIHGVPGERDETVATTKKKFLDLLKENVTEREWSADDFVRVHRLRTKKSGPQPIIARFLRSDDRYAVLNSRPQLKNKGVGVSTDLSSRQRDQLHRLKEDGKKGYFKNGRLVVVDNPVNHDTERRYGNAGSQEPWRFGSGDRRGFSSRGNSHNDRTQRGGDRDRTFRE